ncbi:MAG: hypothetical protein RMJ51_04775 [Candidatus Calescibacterium sp.]|nr:hypothetical protein [Candidatus Calescibacterium sp.]MCX7972728.1 hypothetical protein [bacterium]MDW8195532.1 hypothetical protein [Candidatus Calescibacterium sp.]
MNKDTRKLDKVTKKITKFLQKINIYEIFNKNFFEQNEITPFVVGGLIRDTIFNKKNDKIDVDIVLYLKNIQFYKQLLRHFCEECNYKIVELDDENLVYRVVINEKIYIDLTCTNDIHKDFQRRDFTINSLYFDIQQQKIIDFDNCLNDISHRKLKVVNLKNLIVDPIRMLRGIRFKNEFNLKFDPQTKDFMKHNFYLISNTNPVRMRQELLKIFNILKSFQAIQDLIEMKFFEIYNINIPKPEELIEIIKIFDLSYYIYSHILSQEYEFQIREKNYYLLLLISSYILKNSREINTWGGNIIFGENILRKSHKIINDWSKREDPKFVINIFKHKNNHQTFDLLLINLLLNISKINNEEYICTLQTLFKVCNYICEYKETILPFDKYIEIFNTKDYDKYVEYIISTLI